MLNDDNYVFGDQNVQVPAHLNFGKFMLDHLRLKKDEIALELVDTREKLTYKEFTQYAVNMSIALKKLGVRRGDIVAVGSERRNIFVPTIFAVMFTGATCTPYDLRSETERLKYKINLSKPKYFICSNLFWNAFSDMIKSFDCIEKFITLDDGTESVTSIRSLVIDDVDVNKFEPAQVQGQSDVALILYSSGTTGLPKGIQLTHLNCILNSLPDDFSNETLKTAFVFGEWCHNYEAFMTYKFLCLGRKVVYIDEVKSNTILRAIQDCDVNIIFVVPSLLSYLSKTKEVNKFNLDSLKIIYARTMPFHVKMMQEVKRRFPKINAILQGYGMTEAGELTSESWGTKGPKPGSVGMASPGITLKIFVDTRVHRNNAAARVAAVLLTVVDLDTRKTLGPNQRGEICVKGPVLMKGYVDMPLSNFLDEDGFIETGDLGYFDADKHFYIVDRLKEIIVCDGSMIVPLELEIILQSHPGVWDVAVVGKPVPVHGQEPVAFVVKQPGVEVTEKELVDYVAAEVPPFMQLRGGVKFIEDMPRYPLGPRGKIRRHTLREMLK